MTMLPALSTIREYYDYRSNLMPISVSTFVTTWNQVTRKLGFSRDSASEEGVVSVVIPTYNDIEYLQRAVSSVTSQTYGKVEVVIIDSSEDKRAQHLVNTSEDIRYVHQEPRGPAAARNAGIEASKGEFVAFLDADDEWLPTKLERQINALVESNASFCFCDQYRMKNGDRYRTPSFELTGDKDHVRYFNGGNIGSRTVVVRKCCLEEHRFNEALNAREDPHLWVRLLRDYKPVKINEPLAIKHIRDDSLTSDFEMVYEEECRSINDLCNRYPELRQHREARLWEAKYKYIKRTTLQGESRYIVETVKLCLERFDIRAIAVLFIMFLPPTYRRPLMKVISRFLSSKYTVDHSIFFR